MKHFLTTLGGEPVTIYFPGIGEFDPELFGATFPEGGLYGFDVETRYLVGAGHWQPGWHVRTAQVATIDQAWVLRMDDPAQEAAVRQLLAGPSCFASHMQMDAISAWAQWGIDMADRTLDTHWLSIMTAPDDRKGGADLKVQATKHGMPELANADRLLDQLFDARYREAHPEVGRRKIKKETITQHGFDTCPVDHPVFAGYAGLDALAVRRVAPMLVAETKAPVHLLAMERWLSAQAIRIRQRGFRVDRPRLEALRADTAAVVADAETVIGDVTGLKPTQGMKLVDWFETQIAGGWPASHPRSDKTDRPSLAKENAGVLLTYPLSSDGRTVAEAYVKFNHVLDRLRKTDDISMRIDADGLIHPELRTVGTVTGRMAASEPNMQNFSKKDPAMRGLFLPEPGHVLISCDFAQIELRVLAALAKEPAMIDVILAGGDLHQLTADLLDIKRQEAKTVNFLIVYGGKGKKLWEQLGYSRPVEECHDIVRTYWDQYPAISELNDQLSRLTDHVRLISGRRVPVGRYEGGGSKSHANLNYLIQGSARELLAGSWRSYAGTPEKAAHVWLPVHDELILQVPEDDAETVCKEIESCMTFDFMGVPVQAEADILLDEHGVSRWMPGDMARKIRMEKEAV